jgi:sterol desaturase/sphingolipid hydroxylase (fatty acid hydroxylase superfamily)
LRFHPGELLLSLPVRLIVLLGLGAPVLGVVAFEAAFALANFLEHGDIDYPGWLERRIEGVLVTPALHRRHHGRDAALLGTNFATIFSLWDRAFGTYGRARSSDRVETGLEGAEMATRLAGCLRLPFSRSPVSLPQ